MPKIPASSLTDFEAEIERQRKTDKLIKLGNTAQEAVASLRKLDRKRNR
jgi:hypothetical protein